MKHNEPESKVQDEALYRIRHSLSHLLASVVLELFPQAKLGVGPPTEEGFYYDFLLDDSFSSSELKAIENRIKKLASQSLGFERSTLSAEEAKRLFSERGEIFKVELIDDLVARGEQEISLYSVGNFVDLCRGPHIENTRQIPLDGFKLDRVAGAYWKGNERNQMLTRIYGLAFPSHEELVDYLKAREDAERRDHRKLGRELDLFAISEEVGRGLPLLTEKGTTIYRTLERFIVDEEISRGYKHVHTPILGKKHLYETSGHWGHYQDSMYPPINVDGEDYILRPMTCPHHFMLYASKPHSYKELPLKYAEISPMYRKERSGALSGLIRVMGFHLADAHIFITPDDLKSVFEEVIDLIEYVMKCLGLTERCWYRVSLRDNEKEKYIDAPESWAISEKALIEICDEMGIDYEIGHGDAAFYGPKLDVQMRTVGGREETLFTNQIDLALSERFDLEYISQDGSRERPWIVHRSSIGCLERTIAFLTEHYAGAFPTWLAPIQAIILPITERHLDFSVGVQRRLQKTGIRVEVDDRNESLNRKVREARLQKIPYLCVVGDQEVEADTLMITNRDTGTREKLSTEDFVLRIVRENARRSIELGCVGSAN